MVLGCTGSIESGTGQYMIVLGKYSSVLIDTLWYWVIMERRWIIFCGTGSVWLNTCWFLVVLDQYKAVIVDTL